MFHYSNNIKSNITNVTFINLSNTTNVNKISCNILIAHGGDTYAGFATLIFTYPINFISYSIAKHYSLWIDYRLYYDKNYDPKNKNVFEYYFQPINPFDKCNKTTSQYTTLTKKEIKHRIHTREPTSIHNWYYNLPNQKKNYYNATFYYNNRLKGSQIVSSYFHLQPELIYEMNNIWNKYTNNNNNSINDNIWLGIYMDKVQKWSIRRVVKPYEYMPYISSFIEYFGTNAKIFFATDDANYYTYVKNNWNKYVKEYIKYPFEKTVFSQNNTAVFNLKVKSEYLIGKQVLFDILLLSKCDWFIHASSAVSEAVFFNNFNLHSHSIHIEYTQNRQIPFWINKISHINSISNHYSYSSFHCIGGFGKEYKYQVNKICRFKNVCYNNDKLFYYAHPNDKIYPFKTIVIGPGSARVFIEIKYNTSIINESIWLFNDTTFIYHSLFTPKNFGHLLQDNLLVFYKILKYYSNFKENINFVFDTSANVNTTKFIANMNFIYLHSKIFNRTKFIYNYTNYNLRAFSKKKKKMNKGKYNGICWTDLIIGVKKMKTTLTNTYGEVPYEWTRFIQSFMQNINSKYLSHSILYRYNILILSKTEGVHKRKWINNVESVAKYIFSIFHNSVNKIDIITDKQITNMSLEQQIDFVSNYSILVSPNGGLAFLFVLMKPNSVLITLDWYNLKLNRSLHFDNNIWEYVTNKKIFYMYTTRKDIKFYGDLRENKHSVIDYKQNSDYNLNKYVLSKYIYSAIQWINNYNNYNKKIYSSFLCIGGDGYQNTKQSQQKSCKMKNICYNISSKDFIYFSSNNDIENNNNFSEIILNDDGIITEFGNNFIYEISQIKMVYNSIENFSNLKWIDNEYTIYHNYDISIDILNNYYAIYRTIKQHNVDNMNDMMILFENNNNSVNYNLLNLLFNQNINVSFLTNYTSNTTDSLLCFPNIIIGNTFNQWQKTNSFAWNTFIQKIHVHTNNDLYNDIINIAIDNKYVTQLINYNININNYNKTLQISLLNMDTIDEYDIIITECQHITNSISAYMKLNSALIILNNKTHNCMEKTYPFNFDTNKKLYHVYLQSESCNTNFDTIITHIKSAILWILNY